MRSRPSRRKRTAAPGMGPRARVQAPRRLLWRLRCKTLSGRGLPRLPPGPAVSEKHKSRKTKSVAIKVQKHSTQHLNDKHFEDRGMQRKCCSKPQRFRLFPHEVSNKKWCLKSSAEPPNQEDAQSMQALESRCKRWPPDIKVPHSRGVYLMLADPPSQSPGRWKQSSTLMTMFPNPPCRPDPHQRQNAANPNQSRRIHLRQRRAFLLPTRRPCWRATLSATWSAARAWRRAVTAGAATSTI